MQPRGGSRRIEASGGVTGGWLQCSVGGRRHRVGAVCVCISVFTLTLEVSTEVINDD